MMILTFESPDQVASTINMLRRNPFDDDVMLYLGEELVYAAYAGGDIAILRLSDEMRHIVYPSRRIRRGYGRD